METLDRYSYFYDRMYWPKLTFALVVGLIITARATNVAFSSNHRRNNIYQNENEEHYQNVKIIGISIPESIYLGRLFLFFCLGLLASSTITTFLYFCESEKSASFSIGVMQSAYICLVHLSVSRSLHMPLGFVKNKEDNYSEDLAKKDGIQPSILNRMSSLQQVITKFDVYFLFLNVIIVNYFDVRFTTSLSGYSVCNAGYKNTKMAAKQYGKAFLEFLTVILFSLGSNINPKFRATALFLCLGF